MPDPIKKYPRKRQENEESLSDKSSLESLGNKALLEKNINIRASDYRFTDKIKYYQGYTTSSGKQKTGTKVYELQKLSTSVNDYTEKDIVDRKKPHSKPSGRIGITEHFTKEIKVGRGSGKFDFGAINSEKMITIA